MDIVDMAIIFATEKHSGDVRKGTKLPYIVHPIESCSIASTLTDDKEIIAAAVLHDVLEDTDATKEELKNLFGERVTNLVLSDTENKRRDIPASESWQIRKGETLEFLKTASKEEQIICISDKLSNMRAIYRDYQQKGDKLWNIFNVKDKQKHGWYYSGIANSLNKINDTCAYKEYVYLLNKVFG